MIRIDQTGETARGIGDDQEIETLVATAHQIEGDAAVVIEITEIDEMIPVIELVGVPMTLLIPDEE